MFGQANQQRNGWILKGGYALELRLRRARATRDLDLTVRPTGHSDDTSTAALRDRLVTTALVRLPDFFVLEVGEATLSVDQAPEGGARFPVDARLEGRTFLKFRVDLGAGDDVLEPLDEIAGEDWLGFAGIAPVVAPALSIEQHWAEKRHAYARPREGRPDTRVKDLVDLVLLVERQSPAPIESSLRSMPRSRAEEHMKSRASFRFRPPHGADRSRRSPRSVNSPAAPAQRTRR